MSEPDDGLGRNTESLYENMGVCIVMSDIRLETISELKCRAERVDYFTGCLRCFSEGDLNYCIYRESLDRIEEFSILIQAYSGLDNVFFNPTNVCCNSGRCPVHLNVETVEEV